MPSPCPTETLRNAPEPVFAARHALNTCQTKVALKAAPGRWFA